MARPRKFDEVRAVDAAMEAFWAAGYEATSTQDLCDATGLGRSSIYNTFKSKHDLFERALARYMERKNGELTEFLDDDTRTARQKLRGILQRIIDEEFTRHPDGRGCLVVNTAIEVASHDAPVAAALERDYGVRLEMVRAVIERGQRDGDIAADRDSRTLAHLLIAAIGGIRVSARAGVDRAALESVADATLTAF
ncbi:MULTISPECIES: TetR/AcrR family transcriptional regulator [Streptomyces]|uniref:TetR/AcrR family transcriptional regulator n=1 Tax=Streptomyces TaxID=1883 RepID=UPI00196330E2|nr:MULTISPECIES: TetR/AcrR family transcriptional regulator [Streptomyces]QRX94049.1 TetR/AcrR family transcriptional regulator [Streptomyces noursei]UJB43766.1 TetR/AcrR family transcriptional regulator [Streptomyces sp. A1-5]